MVNVINIHGVMLAPTNRYGRVRRLLKNGQAKIVRHNPFTIQLTYEVTNRFASFGESEK